MTWIRTVAPEDAEGRLKIEYDKAIRRAGKVYAIVASMSPNPEVLESAMRLYRDVMHRDSPLSRAQRELLATSVSVFNECHY